MEPPIGFVPLRDAADMVGRKVCGSRWRPLGAIDAGNADSHIKEYRAVIVACKLDPEVDRVIKMIAERCEAGEIAAVYRSVTGGVDDLDRGVWQQPHWRNYFATGTIDLDLPLLDERGRPNTQGYTRRCTREVFVRRQDIDQLVALLSRPERTNAKQIAAIVSRYHQSLSGSATPSIETLERFAQKEGLVGHRDDLRAEYRRQFPNQRVGHPKKI